MKILAQMQDVKKQFGNRTVLESLSFSVHEGEAVALLGPNGAGKTTALSILQGQRSPTAGSVELFGMAPGTPAAMKRIGMTPQDAEFPPQLTPRELIRFASAHYDHCLDMDTLSNLFGMEKLMDRPCSGFSGGERRRVALALAMVGMPSLVFFDEPTTGLDVEAQETFRNVARNYVVEGGTLILTSHNLDEVEHICSRVVLIDNGRAVLSGTIAEIRDAVSVRRVRFAADHLPDAFSHSFALDNGYWSATLREPEPVLAALMASGVGIRGLTVQDLPLDQAISLFNQTQAGH